MHSRRQGLQAADGNASGYCDGVLFIGPKSEHGFNEATHLVHGPYCRSSVCLTDTSLYMEIVPVAPKGSR
jgi:hypothetical protein